MTRSRSLNETICAISTPIGEGGVGIVRISGPKSVEIADKIFCGRKLPSSLPTHTLCLGQILQPETGQPIDRVLLSVMRAPKSYTKEDVVEINSHAGSLILRKMLEAVIGLGARLAEPGEFTRRAFLNGRIDLSQAEAVIELIRAKTETGLKVSLSHLKGDISKGIEGLRGEIIGLLAHLEASIDFAEEDIETISRQELSLDLARIEKEIEKLIASNIEGKIIKEGIKTALIGRPNVGKSSCLNVLLGRERAIVTPIAGTTRDTIEEAINLCGIPLRLIDTAGLGEAKNRIEEEGVRRSWASFKEADLILLILDGSCPLQEEDLKIIEKAQEAKEMIVLLNKSDLLEQISRPRIKSLLKRRRIVPTSAICKKGFDDLREAIKEIFLKGVMVGTEEIMITNLRHKKLLEEALTSISQARKSLLGGFSEEFIALDLKEALDKLGMITGQTVSEEILDEIFSRFCVGK